MHLQRIEITNFACLRDVKLDLTPLHALIGPNDSGKSTILRAVRTLTQTLAMATQPRTDRIGVKTDDLSRTAGSSLKGRFGYLSFDVGVIPSPATSPTFRVTAKYGQLKPEEFPALAGESSFWGLLNHDPDSELSKAIRQNPDLADRVTRLAYLLRLDPDALRQQSGLIPENELVSFYEHDSEGMRGLRLPGIYDAIMNRGDDAFARIAQQVRELFPTVRNVRLRAVSRSDKCLEVELANGARVAAAQMSEGLLYFLAYAALPYFAPASILLVEEPENGLHPSRIRDVMNILKEISKTTQVLIATHSPLVVNELKSDEVTVVTRDPDRGTQIRRLSTAHDFDVRSKVYLPGELWLNYANGVDEADLFTARKSEP